MSGAVMGDQQVAVLETRLEHFAETLERIEKSMEAINKRLDRLDQQMQLYEKNEAGCQTLISARVDAAWRKIEEHDREVIISRTERAELKSRTQEVESRMKLVYWFFGLVGTAVVLDIVSRLAAITK